MAREKRNKPDPCITDEILCGEYASVYQYVLTFGVGQSEAQDITQETFLKAVKSASKFKGDCSLYTYLCTIAKNTWINRLRKSGREIPTDEMPESADQFSIEDGIIEKESSLIIHRILHNLDEPYKEVFSLRVFGQLSYAEIGQLFSKSENWARVTFYRAKKMIVTEYRKDERNE